MGLLTRTTMLLALTAVMASNGAAAGPRIVLPQYRLQPDQLGVVVNDEDPLSVRIARYYQRKRHIPARNMIHVRFTPGHNYMAPDEFKRIKADVDRETPSAVQAYALTWAAPFRVGCMSITTAFAVGFDRRYCSSKRCGRTHASPYYDSPSIAPYRDYGMRPTMELAATSFARAKALIDRGVAADDSDPSGTAYLVSTSDKARNVRAVFYPRVKKLFGQSIRIRIVHANAIRNRHDVLFYFTGEVHVPDLDTLTFRPGAIADHLTSAGGQLFGGRQMSSLRWLQAGATGSYGTVVEPCNYLQKFPNPAVVMRWYLRGETLLGAYWKSVAWPGQGLFIGEPLASPFGGYRLQVRADALWLDTHVLAPGRYRLQTAPSPVGPYRNRNVVITARFGQTRFRLPRLNAPVYRLQPLPAQNGL
ncbi:MAG TPA: TIGR03790 family protein [Gammaproteobacteria bacterium]|nr:TIGR03790 family protein [Gammaproteobacteria bacterium]